MLIVAGKETLHLNETLLHFVLTPDGEDRLGEVESCQTDELLGALTGEVNPSNVPAGGVVA